MSAVDDITDLEQRRIEAINRQDLVGLRKLLADDYQHCHATGLVQTVDESVAHIGKNARQIKQRAPHIRLYGDSGVLTGELVNVINRSTEPSTETTLWVTQVVQRIDGEWRFVSFQATKRAS